MDISINVALESVDIKLKSKSLSSNQFSAVMILSDASNNNLKLIMPIENIVELRDEINEFLFKVR
ncbi:hypothetical protein M769_0121920 [Bacillus haynesii]|nr:hypothetical protein M769_0121920 [Bacillus haynesii]